MSKKATTASEIENKKRKSVPVASLRTRIDDCASASHEIYRVGLWAQKGLN